MRRLVSARALLPLVVALVVFGAGCGILAWARHDPPRLQIDATFSADACCSWQVWVNDSNPGNLTILPMQWGTEATYTVPVYRSHIGHLSIPVGTQPGGRVLINGIRLTRGSRVVGRVTLAQLQAATTYHATKRDLSDGIEVRGTDVYPAIDLQQISLDTHESALRLMLVRAVTQRLPSFVAILLLATLLTTVLAVRGRGSLGLPLGIAATLVAVRGLPWLSWRLDFQDDVSHAVGYASYVGIWKGRERFIVDAAVAAALAVPVAVALVGRLRRVQVAAVEEEPVDAGSRPVPRWLPPALVTAPVVVAALAGMPNLRALIGPPPQLVPSWDANNFIFWQYLVQKTNLEPIKDFFWPYGFQWLFDEPAPWGPVASYLWFLSFWAFLALGAYVALSRFLSGWTLVRRYVLVAGFFVTALLSTDAPFTTRYVGPLGLVLLYVGIDPRDRLRSPKRLAFAVAALSLTLFEVAQTLYALAPIGFLLLVELATEVRRTRADIGRWAARATATIGMPLGITVVVLLGFGILHGTTVFYEQELVAASAYAFPSTVDQWVTTPKTLESLIFWAVPVSVALGMFGLVKRRGHGRASSAAVVALGLLGFMMLQKQILRPHSATQIWLPLVFGLVYWAMTAAALHRTRRAVAVAATAGALAALVLVSGGYEAGWRALSAAPARLSDSVGALIHQRGQFAAQEKQAFGARSFAKFDDYKPVIRALRATPAVRAGGPVWVLGDDTAVPMMLGESWPYYFNDLYDTSPLAFQKIVLDRLRSHPPARAVWNFSPAALVFDAVPSPVRVPLLYSWAVRSLVPERQIGTFAILRPRRPGEPIALDWWKDRIGATLNLGHIPEAARLSGERCTSGPDCGTQLVITFPAGTPHSPEIDVPLTVAGMQFTIAVQASEASRYVVPLDRVWFWAAAAGLPRSVDATEAGGADVTVERRSIDPGVLY